MLLKVLPSHICSFPSWRQETRSCGATLMSTGLYCQTGYQEGLVPAFLYITDSKS